MVPRVRDHDCVGPGGDVKSGVKYLAGRSAGRPLESENSGSLGHYLQSLMDPGHNGYASFMYKDAQ